MLRESVNISRILIVALLLARGTSRDQVPYECRPQKMKFVIVVCLLCACLMASASTPHLHAKKLSAAPKIDGDISDAVWSEAEHVDNFIDPYTNQAASDRTEVWIGYDKAAIYVAFYAHESHPEMMIGREIKPGSEFNGEDVFALRINPFGTRNQTGQNVFQCNLLGTQSEEMSGGRSAKREWRGIWQASTKRLKDGWSGEFRIPWKVLSYPNGQHLSMDLNFLRYQAHTKILSMWSNWTASERSELQGFWDEVDPPLASEKRKLDFLAYAAPELHGGATIFRFGGDIRYTVSPTATALLSISPDFINIENQIASNEFTRTERYLGEVRPFFKEGGDFFELTGEHTFARMFYSQRIGQFDTGARVFGQVRPDLSVGAMLTERFGFETDGVARVEKQFGKFTSLSAYTTYQSLTNGATNQAVGANFDTRKGNFNAGAAAASEQSVGERPDTAGSAFFGFSCPKWFSVYQYSWVQPGFSPALAYIPWTDRKGDYTFSEYNDQYRKGGLQSVSAYVFTPTYHDYSGALQEGGIDTGTTFTFRNDLRARAGWNRERYANGVDDVKSMSITPNASNRFRQVSLYYESGKRADLPSNYLALSAQLRVWRRLDVSAARSVLNYAGQDAQTVFTAGYEVDATTSLSTRYVNKNGVRNFYLAFRKGGATGTEYYLIIGDPNASRTANRISVKVVWAF